jgi:uncharacterized protein (DUF58 family)
VLELLREGWDLLFRRHLSLTAITIIFFVCVVSALSTGFWLPTRLAYLIVLGVPLAYQWHKMNGRNLEVTTERPVDRLQEGQEFIERITVKNKGWFTKLWLEVEDSSSLPGHNAARIITLGPRESKTWRTSTLCRRRGLFSVGPVKVTTGDPFGFFRSTTTFGRQQSVLVYPRATELPNFYVPPAHLPGEGRFRKRTHYVTPNASGIRPYEPGDSFNRIHWPTVARTNQLMVKLFELDPASDIWVILDLDKSVHFGEGDGGTEEHAVRVAASIARFFLLANRSVGFISFGKRLFVEEAERGAQHYTRILEALALATAEGDVDIGTLVTEESKRFGRHTTVVVVTPSAEDDWVGSLQYIAQRGVKVAAVILDPATFGSSKNSLMVFGALAAGDIYTYVVRKSEDLDTSLAFGTGTTSETIAGRAER